MVGSTSEIPTCMHGKNSFNARPGPNSSQHQECPLSALQPQSKGCLAHSLLSRAYPTYGYRVRLCFRWHGTQCRAIGISKRGCIHIQGSGLSPEPQFPVCLPRCGGCCSRHTRTAGLYKTPLATVRLARAFYERDKQCGGDVPPGWFARARALHKTVMI